MSKPAQLEAPERIWLPIGVVDLAAVSPELKHVDGAYYVSADAFDAQSARIKLLEEQNASQRARMKHAQAKLKGGNDCFDSLEEVVEATVRSRGEMRRQAMRIRELEDALESINTCRNRDCANCANLIRAALKGSKSQ